jgi:hypothetical protein
MMRIEGKNRLKLKVYIGIAKKNDINAGIDWDKVHKFRNRRESNSNGT